jgi:hypothetical protein
MAALLRIAAELRRPISRRATQRKNAMAELKKNLARDFKIDRAKVDAKARTVELAFSSETPVERWGEMEVLGHADGEADLSRLNSDHPLMLGHNEGDPKSQIGVIESARVDNDRVGRAVVRFSKSALAEEIFQDVKDGIRNLVSVGYDRTAVVSSNKDKTGMVTTRYRWTPTHIAIVPVPADTAVGVGRERTNDTATVTFQNNNMEQKIDTISEIRAATGAIKSGRREVLASRLPHHRTCGSASGGSD